MNQLNIEQAPLSSFKQQQIGQQNFHSYVKMVRNSLFKQLVRHNLTMQTYSTCNESLCFQTRLLRYGSFFTALFIVSIYISTSLAIIISCILGVLWLLSGQITNLPATVIKQPVAVWALLLYAAIIIGFSYGIALHADAFSMIKKYRELFFIPVLIPFLSTIKYRKWAWKAFMIASVLTLSVSYLMNFGFFDTTDMQDPSLKSRITHGIFMAYFIFYCIHRAFNGKRYAWLYAALAMASAYNVFFIVEGRTGQLIALVLVGLFAWQRFSLKGRLLMVIAVAVFLGFFLVFSDKSERINEGFANTQAYLQDHPGQTESSMGQRYTFWKYSLKLISEKPFLGHGTGSFAKEYARVAVDERLLAQHPHNEFLFIGVQLGLLGLIPYLGFLASQLYGSCQLPDQEKWLAQGLFMSLVVTSLFNTPFYDHTEGHWFAVMIALCFAGLGSGDKTALADA